MKKITSITVALVTLVLLSSLVFSSAEEYQEQILLTFKGVKQEQMTLNEFLDLKQRTVELTRTNSRGKTTAGTYTGVHWSVLAEAIGAEAAKSVQVVASDGFEQIYPLEVLQAPDSLFALYQDGKLITKEEHNGQVWFCASKEYTANYWTKFIVELVIR